MGVEQSRQESFPSNIDEMFEICKQNWTSDNININRFNNIEGKPTIKEYALNKAVDHLIKYLNNNSEFIGEPKILEPFAGNGVATKIFYDKLVQYFPSITIKSTDLKDMTSIDEDELLYPVEFGLNSVETIEKYGNLDYNILMMISPPPFMFCNNEPIFGFGDYFAIKKWTELVDKKLIVFVGELGASDGSEGLYKYMIENNPNWKLELREMIELKKDSFSNGNVEKEIFIFKRI